MRDTSYVQMEMLLEAQEDQQETEKATKRADEMGKMIRKHTSRLLAGSEYHEASEEMNGEDGSIELAPRNDDDDRARSLTVEQQKILRGWEDGGEDETKGGEEKGKEDVGSAPLLSHNTLTIH